jgi:fructosamine-3-kinase
MKSEARIEATSGGKKSRYFHAEAATLAAEDAAAAYQGPSVIAAGADAQHVSLLSAMLTLRSAFCA